MHVQLPPEELAAHEVPRQPDIFEYLDWPEEQPPKRLFPHNHSLKGSRDGGISLRNFRRWLSLSERDQVAVTDHNYIGEIALALAEEFGDRAIVGVEMDTIGEEGELVHLVGHRVKEDVERGQNTLATAHAMRAQGAYVYVPHALLTVQHGASERTIRALDEEELIDAFEVWHGRSPNIPIYRRIAERRLEIAQELGLPAVAATDAHGYFGSRRMYTEIDEFLTEGNYRDVLARSTMQGRNVGIIGFAYPTLNRAFLRKLKMLAPANNRIEVAPTT